MALNGHVHFAGTRQLQQTKQITLPTLNPYQAISNNHFDGSGQQGFGLLDAQLRFRMCIVTVF